MTATTLPPPAPSAPRSTPERLGVVLVHGMRQHGRTWAAQEKHLTDAGHRVVPVDLPGHGARLSQRFTLEGAYDVVDEAVATFPTGMPVVLVGQSLGGYVCLGWAARHGRADDPGTRLVGVVASGCSTDPRGKPVAAYGSVADAVARAAAAVRRRLVGRAQVPVPAGTPETSGTSASVQRPGWDLVTDALGQLAGRSALTDLAAVRAPVYLVNGSRCHLRWQQQRYLRTGQRCALVVVPRTGHDVQLDAPDVYNRILSRALDEFSRA
ncbi:alpha/beta fold hydrolase [Isoptericola jiangsuensis]|uniref:alpha/beta fold hydrolase n=1 Tax=Isoptericola jiangsuensis TaxID=548579 RepID=UPI003AACB411